MKTTLAKKNTKDKKWYIIDAKDQVLGDLAVIVANKLRGKDKPTFTDNVDCGDFVIVINCDKIKLTGKKWTDKKYFRHSGYPGGFKEISAEDLMKKHPTRIVETAVDGMLPKNRLRKGFMMKLKLYAGESHPHEAQQAIKIEVK